MKGRIKRPEAADSSRLMLPRIGILKIGYLDPVSKSPTSVDYFIPDGRYKLLFTKAYGKRPKTIQIVFPDDDATKVCNERFEYRDDDGKLISSGDGEVFKCWDGKKYIDLSIADYPKLMEQIAEKYPNWLVKSGGDGWRIVLTLNFILPTIRGVAGVWQFTTKGTASTIPQIKAVFDSMLEKRGFCKGILFDLSVDFAQSQRPDDKRKYPVVSLVENQSPENILKVKQIKSIESNGENKAI